MNYQDKVVVITGASSGIGRELALQLAAKGAVLAIAARRIEPLNQLESEISKNGGKVLAVQADVSKRIDVEKLVKKTIETFGRLDSYISNAGLTHPEVNVTELSEDEVRRVMETNFMAALFAIWAAVPAIKKNGGGQMVFVGSIIGKRGIPQNAIYCASKFAIQGLTESLRLELVGDGIEVITVCPPGVATDFFENNRRTGRQTFHLHRTDKIARLIIEGCERGKREILPTFDAKLLANLSALVPGIMDWAVAKNKKLKTKPEKK